MARLYLVRHAEPAAVWGTHPDPGLSELGHQQAARVAGVLAAFRPVQLVSSPLQRCQQTAWPLANKLGLEVRVEPLVAEIPVPDGTGDTRAYLTAMMAARWDDATVSDGLRDWREGIGRALLGLSGDCVVFSHFVAINAAVSLATQAQHIIQFKPGHASVTIVETRHNGLHLVELGAESPIALT
jgi:broad specificity phosphatase PhoE